jgi:hypothetical protein
MQEVNLKATCDSISCIKRYCDIVVDLKREVLCTTSYNKNKRSVCISWKPDLFWQLVIYKNASRNGKL